METVLTVDVGNTTTRFGLFAVEVAADPQPLGSCEFTTLSPLTRDEARVQIAQALALLPGNTVGGTILSCVVPSLTDAWRQALSVASGAKPLVVGNRGLKSGVQMKYDDPSEVGPDRVADVVAARATYGAPAIVIDLGTTTNFEVIDEHGAFAGGIIAPVWRWERDRSHKQRRVSLSLSSRHPGALSAATHAPPCNRAWSWARSPASTDCSMR